MNRQDHAGAAPPDGGDPAGRPVRATSPAWGGLAIMVGLIGLVVHFALQPEEEPTRARFQRRPGPVRSVAYAPGGRALAVGRSDGALEILDLSRGEPRSLLTAPGPAIHCVAFSPDGTTLASGGVDGSIRLWDLPSGRERALLRGHTLDVRSLAFSPDGRTLASGSFDGQIKLWGVESGREDATLRGTDRRVYGLAFSPDGRTLAAGIGSSRLGAKGLIVVWDPSRTSDRGRTLGQASFATVAFAPDGKTLAAGGGDRVVRLWDVATGGDRGILEGHEGYIDSLAFSPDGRTLATGGQDKLVGFFDITAAAPPAPTRL